MGTVRLVIPKGRIFDNVVKLMNDAGYRVKVQGRELKPVSGDPEIELKIMKPQNIPQLVALGSHDAGFAGTDWCRETGSAVETVLDLGFDPVRIVAAVPGSVSDADLRRKRIVVASEYERITKEWLDREKYDYHYLRVYGATEVFPPDDADMIVDNTASGSTLRENNLRIVGEIMRSSTCFIANAEALKDPWKRQKIAEMRLLFASVLTAAKKVMLEMNIPADKADAIIPKLPCMKAPTVAKLAGDSGFAAKIVVNRDIVSTLIPELIRLGATDILEYEINKVIVN
jgi:ATP phosphoribosyltransferase